MRINKRPMALVLALAGALGLGLRGLVLADRREARRLHQRRAVRGRLRRREQLPGRLLHRARGDAAPTATRRAPTGRLLRVPPDDARPSSTPPAPRCLRAAFDDTTRLTKLPPTAACRPCREGDHLMTLTSPAPSPLCSLAAAALAAASPVAAWQHAPAPRSPARSTSPAAGKRHPRAMGQALAPAGSPWSTDDPSCLAVGAILNGTKPIATTPTDPSASYYDTTGPSSAVRPRPRVGQVPDIGISDVFPTTCPNPLPDGLPSPVRDFFGPVEAYDLRRPQDVDADGHQQGGGLLRLRLRLRLRRRAVDRPDPDLPARPHLGDAGATWRWPSGVPATKFRAPPPSRARTWGPRSPRPTNPEASHRHSHRRGGHQVRHAGEPSSPTRTPGRAAPTSPTRPPPPPTRATCATGTTPSGARSTCTPSSTPQATPSTPRPRILAYLDGTMDPPAASTSSRSSPRSASSPSAPCGCSGRARWARSPRSRPSAPAAATSSSVATGTTTCKSCTARLRLPEHRAPLQLRVLRSAMMPRA